MCQKRSLKDDGVTQFVSDSICIRCHSLFVSEHNNKMLSCGLAGLLPPGCYSSRFWPSRPRSFCCCSKWFWMWFWGTAVDIMCLLQNPKSNYGGFAAGYGTNVMAAATCSITKYDDLIKLGTEKPLQKTAATCVDSGINILEVGLILFYFFSDLVTSVKYISRSS